LSVLVESTIYVVILLVYVFADSAVVRHVQ